MVEKSVGIFRISVTPLIRGRRDLVVKVTGIEIEGSPFRLFVKLPPSQLGDERRRITGIQKPWGIAMNNKQQLVVAEDREITVREKSGGKLQIIKCDKFYDIRGVAVAPDGAVYVTDLYSAALFKFDTKGELVKIVQNKSMNPHSVKIINNRLYVVG